MLALVCKAKPCWQISTGNANSKDVRTTSTTVFSEAGRGMKRKMTLSVTAEPQMKKRKPDSPIKTTTEAQPIYASPLAETAGVMSFGKGKIKPT